MDISEISDTCKCDDKTQTKTVSCFNCDVKWKENLMHHERVSQCPKHHNSIAICGGTYPSLCDKCQSEGLTITAEGDDCFPTFKVCRNENINDTN
jgi:hypothetical protein